MKLLVTIVRIIALLLLINADIFGQTVDTALELDSALHHGINLKYSGQEGILVEESKRTGYWVTKAGNPALVHVPSIVEHHGFFVGGAQSDGLYVGRADGNGVQIHDAGAHGVIVGSANGTGFYVVKAGQASNTIVTNKVQNGFSVLGAEDHGLYVGRADNDGIHIASAGEYGIRAAGDSAAAHLVGNVDIVNPSAKDLSISMQTSNSWKAKITQTPSSFLRFANGGANRLSIKFNGHVGIGVSDPSERLDVNGNLKVRGSMTWDPITSYAAVDASAFNAQESDREHHFVNGGLSPRTDFKTERPAFVAHCSLPHGAVVSNVTAYVDDSYAAENIDVRLSRRGVTETIESMASGSSSGSGGNQSIIMTNIEHATIDNQNWSYRLYAEFPDYDTGGINRLRNIVIEYTFSKPY